MPGKLGRPSPFSSWTLRPPFLSALGAAAPGRGHATGGRFSPPFLPALLDVPRARGMEFLPRAAP